MDAILRDVSARRRQGSMDNEHSLVRLTSLCCIQQQRGEEGNGEVEELSVYSLRPSTTAPLERCARVTANSEARGRKMRVLCGATIVLFGPPPKYELRRLVVKTLEVLD